ncbi:MAG: hypothetical protein KDA91_18105 [Planctomycetaceae bacterium]|nr:hypothetical protein [Planctomycetaceae bacterium]
MLIRILLASVILMPAATAGGGLFGAGRLSSAAVPGCVDGCGESFGDYSGMMPPSDICGIEPICAAPVCEAPVCAAPIYSMPEVACSTPDVCGDMSIIGQYPDYPVGDFCGDGCGEYCGEGCNGFGASCDERLLGLFRRSDDCFRHFISPMTNPVFFEDPRTLTEARFIYINNQIPGGINGGTMQWFGLQLRAAVSENVSIIVNKTGYTTSGNALADDGWSNISAGFKYNLYRDVAGQSLVSLGATLDMPSGSSDARTTRGNGEFNLFMTSGREIAKDWHYLMAGGWRLPVDQNSDSTSIYWSNHIDKRLGNSGFYLLGECNWYHWTNDGTVSAGGFEGLDLINRGAIGVNANDVVTTALGIKFKPSAHTEIGFAWEKPVTGRKDIIDDRFTMDLILRY